MSTEERYFILRLTSTIAHRHKCAHFIACAYLPNMIDIHDLIYSFLSIKARTRTHIFIQTKRLCSMEIDESVRKQIHHHFILIKTFVSISYFVHVNIEKSGYRFADIHHTSSRIFASFVRIYIW